MKTNQTEDILESIRKIMKEDKITVKELAQRLNKTQSATSNLLHQKNISIDMLSEICNALNYRLNISISKEKEPFQIKETTMQINKQTSEKERTKDKIREKYLKQQEQR